MKKLVNKFFIFLTIIALSFSSCVQTFANEPFDTLGEEEDIVEVQDVVVPNVAPASDNISKPAVIDNDIEEVEVPLKDDEGLLDIVIRFLKVMGAVVVSSVAIFFILIGMKKVYGEDAFKKQDDEEKAHSLVSSDSKSEALKTFLNRTKDM